MPGPLANVDTVVGGINLDVGRLLYYGPGIALRFLVPDTTQLNNMRTILVLDQGFDRFDKDSGPSKDGDAAIFRVADPDGNVGLALKSKDVHIEILDEVFKVGPVPNLAPNVGQIYTLNCKTVKTRQKFFGTK